MKHGAAMLISLAMLTAGSALHAAGLPDIREVPQDLTVPRMTTGEPAPGKCARQTAPEYNGTEVHHALYLPMDWRKGGRYPVIVEYAGNGPYRNKSGDKCTGKVEDCNLGYGVSAGKGFIWVCLPYVSKDRKRNQLQWWGDVEATVDYCKKAVRAICRDYGGDAAAVLIAGFSRGAIACNFIGLHDNEIAGLWRGFIAHSHYDGVRKWRYPKSDRRSADERLKRLRGRPQFVSHEGSVEATRKYLENAKADGAFTFQALPYRNHTDSWVLRDIPERKALREWVARVLKDAPGRPKSSSPRSEDSGRRPAGPGPNATKGRP